MSNHFREIQLNFAANVKSSERKGKKRGRENQPHVIHAHNSTRHEAAGCWSLFNLPVDVFGLVTVSSLKGHSGK